MSRLFHIMFLSSVLLLRTGRLGASDSSEKVVVADPFFVDEVWAKVGERSCLKCHKAGGDAEDNKFVLQDPSRDQTPGRHASMNHNRTAFARMAVIREA